MADLDDQKRLEELARKYLKGIISAEEQQEFDQWFAGNAPKQQVTELDLDETSHRKALLARIHAEAGIGKTRTLWPRIAAAASILLTAFVGTYYFTQQPGPAQVAANPELISPAQKGVTLTLGNGQKIQLDQRHRGKTKIADGTQVDQTESGMRYGEANSPADEKHTLTNNSGSKFSLTLADGTEAYLDVASSITYPVRFKGHERRVAVTGQAYFKVRHNARQPFLVTTQHETIEDIGTEFNVDAYPGDADLKTTLVEGSVRIRGSNLHRPAILKPGEQFRLQGEHIAVLNADIEAVTAWMQGKLVFNHENLESILAKVARIYDVQFVWQDEQLKKLKYNGAVSRSKKLNTVLNFFRKTGEVDFLVQGKTVKVFKRTK